MRLSTDGDRQVLDLQRDALLAAGADERYLHEDHVSGGIGTFNCGITSQRGKAHPCWVTPPPHQPGLSLSRQVICNH
jgi:hypothetical protein